MKRKMMMTTEKINVSKDKGVTAYEIAGNVLEKNGLGKATEQSRFVLEEYIIKINENSYRFAKGDEIEVPVGKAEIAGYISDTFKICNLNTSHTKCHDGWRLTIRGRLVKGKSGWLRDENGLYILKDGRRLNGGHKECTDDLKIGDKDIWRGLDVILGTSSANLKKDEYSYNTVKLIRDYGENMPAVVYQALQINIGYTITSPSKMWVPCKSSSPNGAYFNVIGRDETDIPIIVTRVGNENAKNKLVIAGPHGNERNARFVVLETQKYFIENGISDPDLVLYLIPAMSPTMFFADARGLPFVEKKEDVYKYKKDDSKTISEQVKDICDMLTIPRLHDFMATKINEKSEDIVHDHIQLYRLNGSSKTPKYGIDTNRDYHSLLKSTQAFNNFIKNFIDTNIENNKKNSTVIMLHGHENANTFKGRINNTSHNQGTVLCPYIVKPHTKKENVEVGHIESTIMGYVDYMTYVLFGYKFELRNFPDNDPDNRSQTNYFFGGGEDATEEEKVAIVTSFKGEWARKLYNGDEGSRGIPCFDIELSESYRDGTRGKKEGGKGRDLPYDSNNVVKRHENFQFFKKNGNGTIDGRFAIVPGKISYMLDNKRDKKKFTISFFDLLLNYFKERAMIIDGLGAKK
jgi:hypothetical protein